MSTDKETQAALIREVTSLRARVSELGAQASEYEQNEEALRKGEERFRKIFEHSNDAIFVVDPMQDQIIDVNPRACTMLGYPREELISLHMSAIHPTEMDKVKAFAESVFENGYGWTNELTCLTKAGEHLPAEISASFIDLGQRSCMIALVRDVTERKRAEDELKRYKDQLEELVGERTRELAAANRELNKLRRQLEMENTYLRDAVRTELAFGEIVGRSPSLKKVLEQVGMVAHTDASVLLLGETGTGKEMVARAIHEQSNRSKRSMIKVNCGSVPRELFESEFFGHVKGAFTGAVRDRTGRFQLAEGGTLFLDEVGEIPLELQSKFLRVLQEGTFERVGEDRTRKADVRIITATNRDLKQEAHEGRFRQDLYYRLSVFPIEVPPLRERIEDIVLLARHFLQDASKRLNCPKCELNPEHLEALQQYDWPGNVRELQNVIERAVIISCGGPLQLERLLPEPVTTGRRLLVTADLPSPTPEFVSQNELKQRERDNIVAALEHTNSKIYGPGGAAELLGLKPTTLVSRMKRLGIRKRASE